MEMAGASISLCKIAGEEMKRWLDAPVCTPFTARSDRGVKMDKITAEQLPALYECVAEVFAEKKDELCAMDALTWGDGDLGLTMQKGYAALPDLIREEMQEDVGKR